MVPLLSSIGLHESLHIFDTFSKVSSSRLDPTITSDASFISNGFGATAPSETLAFVQTPFSIEIFTPHPTTAISISVLGVILK